MSGHLYVTNGPWFRIQYIWILLLAWPSIRSDLRQVLLGPEKSHSAMVILPNLIPSIFTFPKLPTTTSILKLSKRQINSFEFIPNIPFIPSSRFSTSIITQRIQCRTHTARVSTPVSWANIFYNPVQWRDFAFSFRLLVCLFDVYRGQGDSHPRLYKVNASESQGECYWCRRSGCTVRMCYVWEIGEKEPPRQSAKYRWEWICLIYLVSLLSVMFNQIQRNPFLRLCLIRRNAQRTGSDESLD